ncbi:MAG: nuclear transport factor 2 family protein [Acidimicrobiales bacterium]|nr:nuclear transport factor 2 family protein [Acidimicrobiales bacterium]
MAHTLHGGFDAVLHPDVVFHSPVVFTPQVGRDITMLYLGAAEATIGGPDSGFHYTKQVLDGHHAVLEFETTMDGKFVNGVDIITCDDDSMITEFKVMVRPLQAMNVVHAQMMQMLESMAP